MLKLPRRQPKPSSVNATFSPLSARSRNRERSEPVGGIETKMSAVARMLSDHDFPAELAAERRAEAEGHDVEDHRARDLPVQERVELLLRTCLGHRHAGPGAREVSSVARDDRVVLFQPDLDRVLRGLVLPEDERGTERQPEVLGDVGGRLRAVEERFDVERDSVVLREEQVHRRALECEHLALARRGRAPCGGSPPSGAAGSAARTAPGTARRGRRAPDRLSGRCPSHDRSAIRPRPGGRSPPRRRRPTGRRTARRGRRHGPAAMARPGGAAIRSGQAAGGREAARPGAARDPRAAVCRSGAPGTRAAARGSAGSRAPPCRGCATAPQRPNEIGTAGWMCTS